MPDGEYSINASSGLINKRQRIPKVQSKMDDSEKLATCATQDDENQTKSTKQYVLDTILVSKHKKRK